MRRRLRRSRTWNNGADGPLSLDEMVARVRGDYTPDGEHGRDWFGPVLARLADERAGDDR